MTPEQERAAFEAYWSTLADGGASEAEIRSAHHAAWHSWQARAQMAQAVPEGYTLVPTEALTWLKQSAASAIAQAAQPAEAQPVAHIRTWHKNGDQHAELLDWEAALFKLPDGEHKLYTAPPARQPLSGDTIYNIARRITPKSCGWPYVPEWVIPLVRAVEREHDITAAKGEQHE